MANAKINQTHHGELEYVINKIMAVINNTNAVTDKIPANNIDSCDSVAINKILLSMDNIIADAKIIHTHQGTLEYLITYANPIINNIIPIIFNIIYKTTQNA